MESHGGKGNTAEDQIFDCRSKTLGGLDILGGYIHFTFMGILEGEISSGGILQENRKLEHP